MNEQRWQNWLSLWLGLYIIVAPWSTPYILAPTYTTPIIDFAEWSAGLAILIVSLLGLRAPEIWNEWLKLVFGAWLIAVPWVLGFSDDVPFACDNVLTGALLVMIGGTTLAAIRPHFGTDL